MRMYFDIASVVSLFSVVVIFAMLYMRQLADKHRQEMEDERRSRDFEQVYRSIEDNEQYVSRKIDELERNISDDFRNMEDGVVTATRSRRSK